MLNNFKKIIIELKRTNKMPILKKLLEDKEKKQRWLIKNLLPLNEISILYAPKDHHKTGMALKMAMEVITAGQELGASKNGRVLFFSLDTPSQLEMLVRAKALMDATYQDHSEEIGLNLNINFDSLNLTEEHWKVHEDYYEESYYEYDDIGHRELKYKYRDKIETWRDMGHALRNEKYDFLIIDTLSKSIVGHGINDDSVIRKLINNLRKVISGLMCIDSLTILLIHHTGKDARKGMMGTSILSNDVSTVLKIKKNKDGYDLVREKHKSAYAGKSIPFKIRECVVEHQDEKYESIYVDVGKVLNVLESEIVRLFKQGQQKDNIRDNIYKSHGQHYNNKKSFNVVFGRKWNSLLEQGFLDSGQQDNN